MPLHLGESKPRASQAWLVAADASIPDASIPDASLTFDASVRREDRCSTTPSSTSTAGPPVAILKITTSEQDGRQRRK
jgi:hypothetical protein